MVQDYKSPIRVYEYPFELIMAAYEKRFPTCKLIPEFLGSEILNEYRSEDGSIHIIDRRCKLLINAPLILKKLVGVDHAFFIQKNSLNKLERVLLIEARNESFSNRLSINEKCSYRVHPENSDWTIFQQEALLDVKSFFNFESTVEKFAIKAYTTNLKKSKEIILHFVNELIKEGITYVPLFSTQKGCPSTISNYQSSKSKIDSCCSDADEFLDADEISQKNSPSCSDIESLSSDEEKKLNMLQKRLLVSHDNEVSVSEMLKFLKSKGGNVDKAYEMIVSSLKWRKQNDIDLALEMWSLPKEIEPYYYGFWNGFDKDCRPIYVVRLGAMDLKGLLKTAGPDGFLKQVLSITKEALYKMEEASKLYKKPINSWTLLCDLDSLTMRHIWRPALRTFIKIIEIMQENYPESVHRFIIVRVPKVFAVVWSLISTLIDEYTAKKFIFFADNFYGIENFISEDNLPDFIGGKLQTKPIEHVLLPKSFYNVFDFSSENIIRSINCDDIYKKCEVSRHNSIEIFFNINDCESVITWDFDVVEGDITFCLFYCTQSDKNSSNPLLSITNALVNSTNTLANRLGSQPTLTEDYTAELEPVKYEQGSSVQGNFICFKSGSYCLSWKHCSNLNKKSSRIIYYHEILSSSNYKLSISSLNSSCSGQSNVINSIFDK